MSTIENLVVVSRSLEIGPFCDSGGIRGALGVRCLARDDCSDENGSDVVIELRRCSDKILAAERRISSVRSVTIKPSEEEAVKP